MQDPYDVLGVSKTATQNEIKMAYRNLAKKFHPDLNPGSKTAEKKFKDISTAYEMIGTPEARGKFDRSETPARSARRRGPFYQQTQQDSGRYSHSFGKDAEENDFFENLFRSAQRRGQQNYAGEDHLYQMTVDFKDAALGAEREIALPHGKILQVKIPPGVETGNKLRFRSQGGPGVGQAPPGDAYVEIHVRPMEGFTRVGRNIETQVPISFIEALLGAEIEVPTIDAQS